jgi:hypothetical protein
VALDWLPTPLSEEISKQEMQLAGMTSWRIAIDEPKSLLIALFVRDSAGLRPELESDVPPLEPQVSFSEASASNAIAFRQWADWWNQLLEGGGLLAGPQASV